MKRHLVIIALILNTFLVVYLANDIQTVLAAMLPMVVPSYFAGLLAFAHVAGLVVFSMTLAVLIMLVVFNRKL